MNTLDNFHIAACFHFLEKPWKESAVDKRNSKKLRGTCKARSITVTCDECGDTFKKVVWYTNPPRSKNNREGVAVRNLCRSCREIEIEDNLASIRSSERARALVTVNEFENYLEDCKHHGVCDIFAAHHDTLAHDPERLSTEFMVSMVCGTEKAERYRKTRRNK